MIASVLQAEGSVEDCIVLQRQGVQQQGEWVAYVVLSDPFSAERLTTHLAAALPETLIPTHYVPLPNLPLTASGDIDEDALVQIEVVDEFLLQAWETELQELPAVNQVAVVAQSRSDKQAVLHLSELRSDWKNGAIVETEATSVSVVEPETSEEAIASQVPALANGGELPEWAYELRTLPELLLRAAREMGGDRITYLTPSGSETKQSYADLQVDAERILAGFRSLGLQPQDKVIFQLELTEDIIPAFWGCILGGFIPVIMSLPPTYNESNGGVDKLCNVWKLLDQPLILTSAADLSSVQKLSQWLPVEALRVRAIDDLRKHEPDTHYHDCQPDDLAFFNLTSGSTGMPKCIGLTHWNLISRAIGTNILCNHTAEDVILNWLPFDHIGSISDWHVRCVYLGCNLVYTVKEYVLGFPLNWLDLIHKYRITHSWAPNFAYALVNDALKSSDTEHSWDLSCVGSLLTAGEAVSSNAVEEFIKSLSTYGFKNTAIRPAFGMAEMGSGITYGQPTTAQPMIRHIVDKASLNGSIRRVSPDHPNCSVFADLGPVIPGVSIRIVDAQNQVLMEDTIGRLQVKGAAVSPGYYKNPTVNQEVFLADGWFDTGDLGFIANGHLVISGRAKETIIINGANFYNHEIEAVVEELDGIEVSYTAACAVRDPGGNTEKLAIFFHALTTDDRELTELIRAVRQTVVAKVGANPDYLIPVETAQIPKTAIGKIQRSQLSKRFEAGEFDPSLKQVDCLLENANTLPNWFYTQIWRPKQPPYRQLQTQPGCTVVFATNETVVADLRSLTLPPNHPWIGVVPGSTFQTIGGDRYQIDPNQPNHYRQLLQQVQATGTPVTQVLHLWTLTEFADATDAPQTALDQGLYSVLALVQALEATRLDNTEVTVLVGGSYTQPIGLQDPVVAERATMLGWLKAATQELEWLTCRHIDIPTGATTESLRYLTTELGADPTDPEVAYRNGQRLIPRLQAVDWSQGSAQTSPQPSPLKQGGMYVLSGGLGGVGVAIAHYLLETFEAKLLLLGRTALPDRVTWATQSADSTTGKRIAAYQALESLGKGTIRYEAVDLGDVAALEKQVAAAAQDWNCRLDGIFHLAGIAPELSVLGETRDSLRAALYPKVTGARSLAHLVKNNPDALFISFSSVNGFFGGNQTGAYAAANRFLDAFAHTLQYQHQVNSYCMAWSMWDDVGMSQGYQMKEFSRIQGYYAIPADKGIQSLIGSLQQGQRQLWIGLDGTRRNVQQYVEAAVKPSQQVAAYVTLKDVAQPIGIPEDLVVRDRFNTVSQCTLHILDHLPLTESGAIDREQLSTMGRRTTGEAVQPRSEIEKQLAQIWQAVLGINRVGVQDSFFELGGTSIQAAKLFAQIDQVLGTNLPLATLFTAQTIEQLAALIQQDGGNEWSSVVPIQPGGTKPPLFCVHGAGGNILMYRGLVDYLGSDQPLYGLQAAGLNGGPAITQLKEMASLYVEGIQTVQPEGPYYLLGLSVGGMIAVEIARLLQQQGHKVELLGMIDSLGPGYPKLLPVVPRFFSLLPYAASLAVKRLPSLIQKKLGEKGQANPAQREQPPASAPEAQPQVKPNSATTPPVVDPAPQPDSAADALKASTNRQSWLIGKLETVTLLMLKYTPWAFVVPRFYLDSGRSLPENYQKVQEATVKAFLNYQPEPYSGSALLFRASQQPPGCQSDPTLGWGQVIEGELVIYDVPGVHGESLLYKEESLQPMGEKLRETLNRLQS
ncbi:MAG: SDR family NAD(P)-dependent oxidoreductase [Leptolyngbyaceae bacterium]|nr:SDR family NAD(P)-dependent oxidoreductase [Leptolyngbyaceae bacterium]